MRISHSPRLLSIFILVALIKVRAPGQSTHTLKVRDQVQEHVVAYVKKLADVLGTEEVTQEKFARNGHVEATERSKYDYLIMMQGDGESLQLNESRTETSSTKHKALPLLVTNGFSTLLLVFHPYYRDSFEFDVGLPEMLQGRRALPMHFSQISGSRTPAVLAVRGREYPLDLHGTAWLDEQTGEIVSMDATLSKDMSDVGLRSMNVHVEYKSVYLGKGSGATILPSLATVDVETLRQHWRNTHVFTDYKLFSVDAEQDKSVKVHVDEKPKDVNTSEPEEKHKIKERP